MITEFFDSLEPMLRVYWIISIPVTLVFALQLLLSLFGSGSGNGLELDSTDSSDAKGILGHLSFQNLIHFLVGFAWSGIAFYSLLDEVHYTVIISILTGILFVIIFYYMSFGLSALSEDNSFRIEEIVGSPAEVYLTIPGGMKGSGKILVSHKGSVHELAAITKGEPILTGNLVRVSGLRNDNLVIVELNTV